MELSDININFWIWQSIAMGVTALLLPNFRITSIFGATIMVVGLALVNTHLWDAALFMSIPDSISTHAATLLIGNAIIFWVLVKILPGIEMTGVLPALIAPIVFSVVSILLNEYSDKIDFLELGKKGVTEISAARDYLKENSDKESSDEDEKSHHKK